MSLSQRSLHAPVRPRGCRCPAGCRWLSTSARTVRVPALQQQPLAGDERCSATIVTVAPTSRTGPARPPRAAMQVAPGDVDVVGQPQGHRLAAPAPRPAARRGVDRRPPSCAPRSGRPRPRRRPRRCPRRRDRRTRGSRGARRSCGPDHVLHREPERLRAPGRCRPGPPRGARAASGRSYQACAGRAGHHVVAVEGADRDRHDVVDAEGAGVRRRTRRGSRSNTARSKPTRSILLTASATCRTPSRALTAACRRVCSTTPLRASTRTSASSAVEAPVTMLRVYCTCPGVSARMNDRCRRREVAVGDVDGDALLALGAQAVGEQREVGRGQAAVAAEPARPRRGCRPGPTWCRRAAGRPAWTCRRRRDPAWRGGAGSCAIRSTPPSCGPPWPPRTGGRRRGSRPAR